MLTIKKTIDQQELTFALNGRLDMLTAPDLEKELQEMPKEITSLVFDCKDLEYISSAGIRMFLIAIKRLGSSVKAVHVNESVMEILEAVGLVSVMNIEKEAS